MVGSAGLTWVGPDPETIAQMGDKACARTLAADAGVPIVPGSDGILRDDEQALRFGRDHGYPLLLKASAGGGGKGMRVVDREDNLVPTLALARQEASGAFGDDGMYVERYLPAVRHVEVQVLGDHHGGLASLGERDCSLQRRHQKLVEEAPAPNLPDSVRAELSDTAMRLAAAVGYRSAGTVEFLFDVTTGDFAFIEMNTRIQVEHPVTEEITGVDLVGWQLLIAGGEPLDGSTRRFHTGTPWSSGSPRRTPLRTSGRVRDGSMCSNPLRDPESAAIHTVSAGGRSRRITTLCWRS